MKDLNTTDEEAAVRMIAGTARNMGITVEGLDQNKDAKAQPVANAAGKEGK
jgi:large subunit ribosomal protein L11